MELRRRTWAGLRFLGARAHGGIWGHGRDETLIAKVQRERRGPGLGWEGHRYLKVTWRNCSQLRSLRRKEQR